MKKKLMIFAIISLIFIGINKGNSAGISTAAEEEIPRPVIELK
ncbi:hypothetical protein HMPREF1210_02140 [Paenisporosarcina sp. HGH0030]|nr:hypothetical protein [Paenisporosarcina sp. HGH0030]EPD51542.1 hypothetical protein HMPREF1210_02140 [Paenisporosarcina sp. HGH0030]